MSAVDAGKYKVGDLVVLDHDEKVHAITDIDEESGQYTWYYFEDDDSDRVYYYDDEFQPYVPQDEPDDAGNYNYQEEPVTATLKPKVKAYLAGPMRGIKEFNFPHFLAVGRDLTEEWGFEVFNPAQHDIDRGFDFSGYAGTEDLSEIGFDLRQSLGDDLEFVAREADVVVVLHGWEKSKGARAEVATALALGIPVVRWADIAIFAAWQWRSAPKVTEIPPLWEPLTDHVVRNPAYIVSGQPSGEDGEWLEGDTVSVWEATLGPIQEGEVRSVSSTGAEKGTKIERFDLLPTQALAKIARHFGVGAAKYAPNNWRKGYEWSKSYAALQRHLTAFWGGEDYDEETGSPHLAAVGFHVLVLLTYMDEQPGFDDRWKGNDD